MQRRPTQGPGRPGDHGTRPTLAALPVVMSLDFSSGRPPAAGWRRVIHWQTLTLTGVHVTLAGTVTPGPAAFRLAAGHGDSESYCHAGFRPGRSEPEPEGPAPADPAPAGPAQSKAESSESCGHDHRSLGVTPLPAPRRRPGLARRPCPAWPPVASEST